jgi:hypothetical protein
VEEEVENTHKKGKQDKDKGKSKKKLEPTKGKNHETDPIAQHNEDNTEDGANTLMQLDDQDLVNIDMDKLEEAFNKRELQSIPVEQLLKVHKVFIDSIVGAAS